MIKTTTAERLKSLMAEKNLKQIDIINLAKPYCKKYGVKLGRNDVSQYVAGKFEPRQNKLYVLSEALNVNPAWLMGYDVPKERETLSENNLHLKSPNITEEYVTFPVLGEIAAGYESEAIEDWGGETVDVPISYLKGRNKTDFFVLQVKGDSMYPLYHEGDKVLILRQTTLNYSGEIGAILYEESMATLKKVEYATGEDWLRMVPINPNHQPKMIEGADLEKCRVLGIPKLVIREIK